MVSWLQPCGKGTGQLYDEGSWDILIWSVFLRF
jgi:hypothetical protein